MADEGGSYYSLPLLPHRSRFVGYLLLILDLRPACLFYPTANGTDRFYSDLFSANHDLSLHTTNCKNTSRCIRKVSETGRWRNGISMQTK